MCWNPKEQLNPACFIFAEALRRPQKQGTENPNPTCKQGRKVVISQNTKPGGGSSSQMVNLPSPYSRGWGSLHLPALSFCACWVVLVMTLQVCRIVAQLPCHRQAHQLSGRDGSSHPFVSLWLLFQNFHAQKMPSRLLGQLVK
jgi:hypothetical protein